MTKDEILDFIIKGNVSHFELTDNLNNKTYWEINNILLKKDRLLFTQYDFATKTTISNHNDDIFNKVVSIKTLKKNIICLKVLSNGNETPGDVDSTNELSYLIACDLDTPLFRNISLIVDFCVEVGDKINWHEPQKFLFTLRTILAYYLNEFHPSYKKLIKRHFESIFKENILTIKKLIPKIKQFNRNGCKFYLETNFLSPPYSFDKRP